MEEQAKISIYKQLMEFEKISEMDKKELLEWAEFDKLSDASILKYAMLYREKCLDNIDDEKYKEKNINSFYLELPDMNLEGKDLKDVYLYLFMPGVAKDRNNGKKVFITSKINLKDTNCTINLASVKPVVISKDGKTIDEKVVDIAKCDFRGCKIFGKPERNVKLVHNEKLPKEYIDRIKIDNLAEETKKITDEVYKKMIMKKSIKNIKGLDKVKNLVDFDLSSLGDEVWKYKDAIIDNEIDISYTGAFIKEAGIKSVGKENEYIDVNSFVRQAYKNKDMKYVEAVFKSLDDEIKKNIVSMALRDGLTDFIEKHYKELSSLQKKYLELQRKELENHKKEYHMKEDLFSKYREGKISELEKDLQEADINIKSKLVKEVYLAKDLKFVEKHLSEIDENTRNMIINKEYQNENKQFVCNNFDKINDEELKKQILQIESEENNYEFLSKNYPNIEDEQMKEKIQKMAFDQADVDFLRKYFMELPKDMKMESALKYKDLGISETEMMELLKADNR